MLRSALDPKFRLVMPGIRPAGANSGDQRLAARPREVLHAGSNLLVVGRPITRAADPVATAEGILAEMAS